MGREESLMARVPTLRTQPRRTGSGLGLAADPQEARQWGQGFAQLGEATFRLGASLAKANKATRNTLLAEEAKTAKERISRRALQEEKINAKSSFEYVD